MRKSIRLLYTAQIILTSTNKQSTSKIQASFETLKSFSMLTNYDVDEIRTTAFFFFWCAEYLFFTSLFPSGLRFAPFRLSRRFQCSAQQGGDLRRAAPLLQSQAARPRPVAAVSQRQPQRRRRARNSRGRVRRPAPHPQGPTLRGQECGLPDSRRGVRHPG